MLNNFDTYVWGLRKMRVVHANIDRAGKWVLGSTFHCAPTYTIAGINSRDYCREMGLSKLCSWSRNIVECLSFFFTLTIRRVRVSKDEYIARSHPKVPTVPLYPWIFPFSPHFVINLKRSKSALLICLWHLDSKVQYSSQFDGSWFLRGSSVLIKCSVPSSPVCGNITTHFYFPHSWSKNRPAIIKTSIRVESSRVV